MLLRRMLDTKRITLRIPMQVYQELEVKSDKTGNPISSLIRSAIIDSLKTKETKVYVEEE